MKAWKRPLVSNELLLEGRPWDCRNTKPGGNLPGYLKTEPILHRGETEAKRVQVASPRSLLQLLFLGVPVINLSPQGGTAGRAGDLGEVRPDGKFSGPWGMFLEGHCGALAPPFSLPLVMRCFYFSYHRLTS